MSNIIRLTCIYSGFTENYLRIPDGVNQEDVEWFVKWGTLHYRFTNTEDYREVDLSEMSLDSVDFKRPGDVELEFEAEVDETEYVIDLEMPA